MMFSGKSSDGSDLKEFEGFHVSEDGNEFSSSPYNQEQRLRSKVYNHLSNKRRTLRTEYHLIKSKQSNLPRTQRDWVLEQFKDSEEEKFTNNGFEYDFDIQDYVFTP